MYNRRNQGRIFYIADLHLFHENLIHPRDDSFMEGNMKARTEFGSVEEMHEVIRTRYCRRSSQCKSDGKVMTKDGRDVSSEYNRGADQALKIARLYNCRIAIL